MPDVVDYSIEYLKTDKGALMVYVYKISETLTTETSYSLNKMPLNPSAVVASNDVNSLVATEFTSLIGKVKLVKNGRDRVYYYIGSDIQPYFSAQVPTPSDSSYISFITPLSIVEDGSGKHYMCNGVTVIQYPPSVPGSIGTKVESITRNTPDRFGKSFWEVGFTTSEVVSTHEASNAAAEHLFSILDGSYMPYEPGGETDPEIGPTPGDWTLPDDELALPGSSYSDLSAGLYRIYAMTPTQVNAFATQLWNTDVMDVISRFFEKPTDVVLGMYSYPFDVQSGNAESVYFNWISQWSTVDVTGHPVTQEIQHLEFGYADIPRYSGTFYDFQPYSVIQMHLPYIGFVEVKANEVVGRRVYLDYYVSLFSGDFTAALTVTGDNSPGVIGLYQGNIGRPVPLTQQDLFTLFKKGAELALTAAIAVGSGGVALAAGAEAAEAKVDMERRIEAGLPISATMAANRYGVEQKTHDEALNVLKKTSVVGAANAMFGNPSGVAIIRNGAVDASSGRTSSQEAYILMTVPHQNVSSEQKLLGYPTNLPGPLSGYTGFTTVRDIRLNVPDATDSERAEIESIVRSGIII